MIKTNQPPRNPGRFRKARSGGLTGEPSSNGVCQALGGVVKDQDGDSPGKEVAVHFVREAA